MIKIAKEKEIPQKHINNVIAKVGNSNIFYTQTFPRALAQAEQIVREYDLELSRGNAISRERYFAGTLFRGNAKTRARKFRGNSILNFSTL